MNCSVAILKKVFFLSLFCCLLCKGAAYGQEASSEFNSNTSYHNQLVFNRFLIHPAYSLLRENKSYINILHRNQYATFADNDQNYYLGFSNRLDDRAAFGIGVYTHWEGVVQVFGLNANYATAVQLSENNTLTFGTNITYLNEGLDKNRIIASENDPEILDARKETKLSLQPGIALSIGALDFGLYAENLLSYNQTTNSVQTEFSDKTVKASLQYTHDLNGRRGLFSNGRIMPLLEVRRNEEAEFSFAGSFLLDLPEYGWLQSTFDDKFGLSLGLGFNLSKRMSIGYVFEKNFMEYGASLGWNHELSLAYTFRSDRNTTGTYKPRPPKTKFARTVRNKRKKEEDNKIDRITRNYEEQILKLTQELKNRDDSQKNAVVQSSQQLYQDEPKEGSGGEMFRLKEKESENCECQNSLAYENRKLLNGLVNTQKTNEQTVRVIIDHNSNDAVVKSDFNQSDCQTIAYQNRLILDELILRQDSMETAQNKEFDKRFNMLVGIIKSEIKQNLKSHFQDSNDAEFETALAAVEKKTIYSINNARTVKYEKLPIKMEQQSDLIGVKSGYYIIANVYKNKENVDSFIDELKQQGLEAHQFYNKINGLYYVYLADYNKKNDAEVAYSSNLEGKYQKDKWIMKVYRSSATADNLYEDGDDY